MKNTNHNALILLLALMFIICGLATKSQAQNNRITPEVHSIFSGSKWPVYPMINSQQTYRIEAPDDTVTIATLIPSKEKNMWYILQPKNNSLYVTGHIVIEGSMYYVYERQPTGKMTIIAQTTTY